MNKEDLKGRTKCFALRVVKLVRALPHNQEGYILGRQLLRSATSVAANYRAVRRSRSSAEFVSKIAVVIEESDESSFWLELISELQLLKQGQVDALLRESSEITAIMVSSKKTASNNLKS